MATTKPPPALYAPSSPPRSPRTSRTPSRSERVGRGFRDTIRRMKVVTFSLNSFVIASAAICFSVPSAYVSREGEVGRGTLDAPSPYPVNSTPRCVGPTFPAQPPAV